MPLRELGPTMFEIMVMVDIYNQVVRTLDKGEGVCPIVARALDAKARKYSKGIRHQLHPSDI